MRSECVEPRDHPTGHFQLPAGEPLAKCIKLLRMQRMSIIEDDQRAQLRREAVVGNPNRIDHVEWSVSSRCHLRNVLDLRWNESR